MTGTGEAEEERESCWGETTTNKQTSQQINEKHTMEKKKSVGSEDKDTEKDKTVLKEEERDEEQAEDKQKSGKKQV